MGYAQLSPEQPPDDPEAPEKRGTRGASHERGNGGDVRREQDAELTELEQERADDEGMIVDLVADVQEPSPAREGSPDA
jgi:hypothetical protein